MNKFTNVHRKEIMVMNVDHEGAVDFTYFRFSPNVWSYTDGDRVLVPVLKDTAIKELEKMYSNYLEGK